MGKGSSDKTSKNDPTRPPGQRTLALLLPGLSTCFPTHTTEQQSSGLGAGTPSCGEGNMNGIASSLVTLSVDVDGMNDKVTISITGPSDVWFGSRFRCAGHEGRSWAVIVEPTGQERHGEYRRREGFRVQTIRRSPEQRPPGVFHDASVK